MSKDVVTISYEEREERSYAIPAAARIIVQDGGEVRAGDPLTSGPLNPAGHPARARREDVEKYLVEEVQKVYRAQGVTINDKHIEIVVRQMLRKVRVETPGDTELLAEQILDRFAYQEVNDKVMAEGGEPATAVAVLLGVTKASLNTESFLAAASFQETTRVLTEAAVSGAVDRLLGPKENVIIGRLIPAQSKEVMAELALPKEPPLTLLDPIGDGEGFEIALGDRPEDDLAALFETAPGQGAPAAAPAGGVPEEQRIFGAGAGSGAEPHLRAGTRPRTAPLRARRRRADTARLGHERTPRQVRRFERAHRRSRGASLTSPAKSMS